MSRIPRLIKSVGIIVGNLLLIIIAPQRARKFFAYVYLYDQIQKSKRIKKIKITDLIPKSENISVVLRNCYVEHGNMTTEEITYICAIVAKFKPNSIFEFGTFNGNTTLQMAINSPLNCKLYTLNLPFAHGDTLLQSSAQDKAVHPNRAGSGQSFKDQPEKNRINELFGDSASYDFTTLIGKFDFVIIDAGHEYNYVKSDTINALRLLKYEGGIIIWHDYPNAPGVEKYLEVHSEKNKIYHISGTRLAISFVGKEMNL